jgi:phage-related protein
MPLETFTPPNAPNVGMSVSREPRLQIAQFGDGYDQRIPDGINFIRRAWTLRWAPITPEAADAIEQFLVARGGYQSFWWTPPRYLQPVRVRCPKWIRTEDQWNASGIEAGFFESFDLDT